MLDAFIATARDRAVPARVVLGEWPGAAAAAGSAGVVVAARSPGRASPPP